VKVYDAANLRNLALIGHGHAGKTSLVRALMQLRPTLRFSISYTTRKQRPNERHSHDYFFVDKAEFEREGVRIEYQEFEHPSYRQCGGEPFIKGLSSLDMLLNCGPASRDLLMKEKVRVAA